MIVGAIVLTSEERDILFNLLTAGLDVSKDPKMRGHFVELRERLAKMRMETPTDV